jgi:hypothetical protein
MNAVNSLVTSLFNVLLTPLEMLSREVALILVSGFFGVFALFIFKYISYQKGIGDTKDKIKGHLIEIRIYQDDMWVVTKAIGKIIGRNLQYVSYNLLPFVPLAIPFVFVLAQFATRYGFEPLPVQTFEQHALAGTGTVVEVELGKGHEGDVSGLKIDYPDFIRPLTELPVRAPLAGRAFQEIVATAPGSGQITFTLPDGTSVTKDIVAGEEAPRLMQPERVQGLFLSLLWPAEEAFDKGSSFARIHFAYPDSKLRWMPDGVFGVLVTFLVASMIFAVAVMKPLKVQI